jgi:hypothetical protein
MLPICDYNCHSCLSNLAAPSALEFSQFERRLVMIVGYQFSYVEQILQKMERSNYTFHLTGSRYFRTNNDQSDWDFFVEDCHSTEEKDMLRNYLLDLGFRKVECDRQYDDMSVLEVWSYYNSPKIDVQIVKSAAHKTVAQELLLSTGIMFKLQPESDKTTTKAMWNLALLSSSQVTDTKVDAH